MSRHATTFHLFTVIFRPFSRLSMGCHGMSLVVTGCHWLSRDFPGKGWCYIGPDITVLTL